MMKLENVGTVIATRELLLDGDQKIEVLIGKPERLPDHDDWYCPWRVSGIGSGSVRYACGVDAAQALILALSMVGATLYCSEEYEDGRIKWFPNSRDANLGFPVSENIRDVLPGQKQPWDSGQGNLF